MPIELTTIHSYLVRPGKHLDEQPAINGTTVPRGGKLHEMLSGVFRSSETECAHNITFNPAEDGRQENPCRTLIVSYLRNPTIDRGRQIGQALQEATTTKSGLGLLFLLSGQSERDRKIVISRFPADSAIMADEDEAGLTVTFLEKVFMKSATSYKAAVYTGRSLDGDFWEGGAVDKQVNDGLRELSLYWIHDFLLSDFKSSSAQGTRRLATVLIKATKAANDLAVKQELISLSHLARGLAGKVTSIDGMCRRFALSDAATEAVLSQCTNSEVRSEQFRFSIDEFQKHVSIRSCTMDSGAIVMAPAEEFDRVVKKEALRGDRVRLSTEGTIVDVTLKRGDR